MGGPAKGRADWLDLGDWNAVCYECGRKRKASYLKKHWQGYYVCPEHWEARHPQDFVRAVPDNQTVPWSQRQQDAFVSLGPCVGTGGRSAIPSMAIPGCAIPSYIDPSVPIPPPPTGAGNSVAGHAVAGISIAGTP